MTPLIREYTLNEINMSQFRNNPKLFSEIQKRQQTVIEKLIELNLYDIATQYAAKEVKKQRFFR